MTRIAVVTGLAAEAKLIEKAHARAKRAAPMLACAGANAERAQAHAARLIAAGAQAVLSFGVCGGLDPALRPGALLLPDWIARATGGSLAIAAPLRAALAERLRAADLAVHSGALFGSDPPVATAADKAALFARTGARAVDMESHGVAAAAAAARVPVVVVRAVADPAERTLPRAVLGSVGPDGRLRLMATLAAMYVRPWEGPALIRLAYEARLAFDTLERIAADPNLLFGGGD